jgi:hypothetical protein
VIFIVQGGNRSHADICKTLHGFAEAVQPEFGDVQAARDQRQAELAPYIAAALKRKTRMPDLAKGDVPVIPPARMRASVKAL